MDKEIVLITGSSGRIGVATVKRLGNQFRIVGFELLKALYASANEELVPVDLTSDESVKQAFAHIRYFYGNKIASVIHLAAYYSFNKKESPEYERVTVKGTERLLKELQNFEVEQFIFSSTMLVRKPCKPGEKITENTPYEAKWGYPRSKIETENLIHGKRGKIPVLILEIAGVYNDHCDSIPLSHQIQRIYEKRFLKSHLFAGNPTHGASFVHMEDLVTAIEKGVQKRKELPPELTLLIGEDKVMSYQELQNEIGWLIHGEKKWITIPIPKPVAKIGSWIQCHVPFLPKPFIKPWMIAIADDHYDLDISKAKKYLDWEPKHTLKETLPKMIQELKQDPGHWYRSNHLTKGLSNLR